MHNDILRKAIVQYQYRSHGFASLGRKTFWKYKINKKILHGLLISLFLLQMCIYLMPHINLINPCIKIS